MDLSVNIVTYNSISFLPNLTKSIINQAINRDFEINVVDNASKDGSVEFIRNNLPNARLIENTTNQGFARAHNQAMRVSKGRYILLLNPDIELKENAINNMISFIDRHDDVGVVGGKIFNPNGSIQLSGKKFPTPLVALLLSVGFHKLFPNNRITNEYYMPKERYNETQEVEHVMGSFMMVRKEAIDKAGLFDESFFLYCEDVDLCMRIKKAGFRIFYLPSSQAIHHKGGSSRAESSRGITEHHKSLRAFYKKWYSDKYPWILNQSLLLGLKFREATYRIINFFRKEKKVTY